MSCMYFHRPHRDPGDSTESSDSITYWRRLLDVVCRGRRAPGGRAAEEGANKGTPPVEDTEMLAPALDALPRLVVVGRDLPAGWTFYLLKSCAGKTAAD
jgi:hypothetical protein